jgi:hypothetical protein
MPIPTPIGVGPRFHPPATVATCAQAAQPAGAARVHLELFARGRVVLIPPGVGCRGDLWTNDPTGVVRFRKRATLGRFFTAWRQRLTATRLLSFGGRVRVYVNGRRAGGDPRSLRLRDGDEIVVEVGPFIPPHGSYLFPRH